MNNSTDAVELDTATLLVVSRDPQPIADPLTAVRNTQHGPRFHVETLRPNKHIVARVQDLHPDIVLLSLALPGVDSLAICRQLKAEPLGVFVSVIMTDVQTEAEALASVDAGADAWLPDSLSPGEILARVQLALRLKRRYDALLNDNQQLAERLIAQNSVLEAALAEVQSTQQMTDNITYNLTHELRTPLLQVKSAVALMRTDGAAGGAPLMDKLITYADAATKRLEAVVSDLDQLVLAMNPLRIEPFRVQDAVQAAIRHVGRHWRWSTTDVAARIINQLDDTPFVLGDRNSITQVLQHLLDNALKFSPGGQPVEIFTQLAEDGAGLWIVVRDQGVGIPEAALPYIFKAFYQVNSSTTRQFGGVGIGLTIVKIILDALEAPLEVESVVDRGSTFRFRLPIASR